MNTTSTGSEDSDASEEFDFIEYEHELDNTLVDFFVDVEVDLWESLQSFARQLHYPAWGHLASDMLHVYVSKNVRKYSAQLRHRKKMKKIRFKIRRDHEKLLHAYAKANKTSINFVVYRILKHMINRTRENGIIESPKNKARDLSRKGRS